MVRWLWHEARRTQASGEIRRGQSASIVTLSAYVLNAEESQLTNASMAIRTAVAMSAKRTSMGPLIRYG